MKCSKCNKPAGVITNSGHLYCMEHEGIERFGKEGWAKITRDINRDFWRYVLCVALPISLIIGTIIARIGGAI